MLQIVDTKKYDIALYDEDMADIALNSISVKMMLCEPGQEITTTLPNSFNLNKYQRVSKIVREIMDKYAEISPNAASLTSKPVKIISVYSPTGGSGKTTVSIALALSALHENMRAVYISLEAYSSINAFVKAEKSKGLSEIFGKIYADINFTAKIQSLLHTNKNITYFEGFDNARDISEITKEDFDKFIDIIVQANVCDLVIIDLDSNYSNLTTNVIKCSDKVLVVADDTNISEAKMQRLSQQLDFLEMCNEKLILVGNNGAKPNFEDTFIACTISKYTSDDPYEISAAIANKKEVSALKILS